MFCHKKTEANVLSPAVAELQAQDLILAPVYNIARFFENVKSELNSILYDRHTVWGDLDPALRPVLINRKLYDLKAVMRQKTFALVQLARSYTLITLKCHRFFGILRWIYNRHRDDPVFFRGDHAIAGIAQSTARVRTHQRKRLTRRGQ